MNLIKQWEQQALQQLIASSYKEDFQNQLPYPPSICAINMETLPTYQQLPIFPISPNLLVQIILSGCTENYIKTDGVKVRIQRKLRLGSLLIVQIGEIDFEFWFRLGPKNSIGQFVECENTNTISCIGSSLIKFDQNGYPILLGFTIMQQQKQQTIYLDQNFIHKVNAQLPKVIGLLKIQNQNIGNQGIQKIANMQWPDLVSMNLWWNNIGAQGVSQLVKGCYPKLSTLDLRKNYIKNQGLKTLSEIQWGLKQLNLSDNNLSDIKCLRNQNFARLEVIDLQNNEINDLSIEKLQELDIQKLNLSNNLLKGLQVGLIDLSKLGQLYLTANNIVSCQFLSRSNLPALKFLSLYDNFISSCYWIKKTNFHLSELWLQKNIITELHHSDQIDFSSLESLRLEFSHANSVVIQNLNWMAKICYSITKIHAASKQRIKINKLRQFMQNKNQKKIDLRVHWAQ